MVSEQYKAYLKTDRGKTAQKAKIEHLERGKKQAKSKSSKKRIQKKIDEEKRLKKEVTPITPKSYIVDGKKVSKAQYEQSVIDKSKKLKEGEKLVAKTTMYNRQYQKKEQPKTVKGVDVKKEQPRTWQETEDFKQKKETWQEYYDRKYKLKNKPTQTLQPIINNKGQIIGYKDTSTKKSVLIPKGKEVTESALLKVDKSRAVSKEIEKKNKQTDKIKNLTSSVTIPTQKGNFMFYPGYFRDYQNFANKKIQQSKSILVKSLFGASKLVIGVAEPILDTPYYATKLITTTGKNIIPILSDLKKEGSRFITLSNKKDDSFSLSISKALKDKKNVKSVKNIISNKVSNTVLTTSILAGDFSRDVKKSFQEDPLYAGGFTTGLLYGGKILNSASEFFSKTIVSTQSKLDKMLPSRPYYVEKLPEGFEVHKGEFVQDLLKYKGESFERGGKVFGVRRVQEFEPKKLLQDPLEQSSAFIDKLKGKKPGQIKYFDSVGQDILLRDVPSEFATPKTELLIPNQGTQTVASVTPDSKFLVEGSKKGGYTSISGGGQELETIQGRAGVGGGELGQFFSVPTSKDIAGVKKGTPQVYTYYSGVTGSSDYTEKLPLKFTLKKPKPGVIFQQENINVPITTKKGYEELAQDLAGYTEPSTFQLSASTIKGVRSELEVIKSPQTYTTLTKTTDINVPGYSKGFNIFYGRNVPLTKKGYHEALDANIKFLENRITEVKNIIKTSPELESKGNIIIKRELRNIENIKLAQQGKKYKNVPNLDSSSKEAYNKFEDLGLSPQNSPSYNYVTPSDLISSNKPIISGVAITVSKLSADKEEVIFSDSSSSPSTKPSSSPSIKPSSSNNNNLNISSISSNIISSKVISTKSSSSPSTKPSSSPSIKPSSSPSIKPSSSSSIIPSIIESQIPRASLFPPFKKSNNKFSTGFGVEVRKKGKFRPIFGSFRTKKEATRFGMFKVGTTARASFRVVDKKTGIRRKFRGSGKPLDFYKKGNVFIEKRGRRIKSRGEVREISLKGVRSQRKGKKFKMY